MRRNRFLLLIISLAVLLSISACFDDTHETSSEIESTVLTSSDVASSASVNETPSEEQLTVHYFDVGQGDSIFIEFPYGSCMLIDASIAEYKKTIENNIRALGYDRIDYVIATHPHADHIGGMTYILDVFEIGCIYLPNTSASTNTFISMAEKILEKDIPTHVAEAGVTIIDSEEIKAVLVAPIEIDDKDQNKNSAVLHLTFGKTSFLFMGDADTDIEKRIGEIKCDVLKVGHHGSRTASDESFLRAAKPSYAIISCGEGNSYGHPHVEAVERLEACGAKVLRTDLLGTIRVYSDGKNISVGYGDVVQTESSDTEDQSSLEETTSNSLKWVLNLNSKKIHYADCRHVDEIAKANKAYSSKTVEELKAEGYTPCGTCKPHD